MNRQAQRYAAASRLLAGIYACETSVPACWEITKQALNDADCLLGLVEQSGPVVDEPRSEIVHEIDHDSRSFQIYPCPKCGNVETDSVEYAVAAERERCIQALLADHMRIVTKWDCTRELSRADLERLLEVKG